MGMRIKKGKKKAKKATQRRERVKTEKLPQGSEQIVTNEQKNDTIPMIDFFGFAPKMFRQDLRRTGWATLVVLVVLAVIFLVVK